MSIKCTGKLSAFLNVKASQLDDDGKISLQKIVENRINYKINAIKKVHEDNRFTYLREIVDKEITDSFSRDRSTVSCSVDCGGYCCRQHIVSCIRECFDISKYIQENKIIINQERFNAQVEFEKQYKTYNNDLVSDWLSFEHNLCLFSVEGRCSIYQVRPITCRIHFAVSNPLECKIGGKAKCHVVPEAEEWMSAIMRLNKMVGMVTALDRHLILKT